MDTTRVIMLSPGYTCKLVCQTTPQTNMLRPFLPLGSAHLLLQTVCREFVLEPAESPQTDKKSQINSDCMVNATLAVCPSNHCFKLIWTNGEWFDKLVCTCNRGFRLVLCYFRPQQVAHGLERGGLFEPVQLPNKHQLTSIWCWVFHNF